MTITKDQAIAMAGAARTPDEIERAMVALAALPDDPEVDAARAALSRAFDQRGGTRGGRDERDASRMSDIALNPGFDNN